MKNLLKNIFIIAIFSFVFSGCSHKVEVSTDYVNSHINQNGNLISEKIESVSILENHSNILEKHAERLRAKGALIKVDHGEINNLVSKTYFSQYFKNVSFTNIKNSNNLYIESEIIDSKFYFHPFPDGAHVETAIKIKAYYKGKLLIDKIYNGEKDTVVYLSARLTMNTLLDEVYHESVLKAYQNEFQKDLLTALKKEVAN